MQIQERFEILLRIADFADGHDYGPSFDDLGGTKGRAYYYCQELAKIGLVAFDKGIARSLRLTDAGRDLVEELRKTEETKETEKDEEIPQDQDGLPSRSG